MSNVVNFFYKSYIHYFFFFLIVSLLFWKCKYGYVFLDEAFYPTIANRFLQGDRILYEEWCNNQLSALVIMPFLKCYYLINGSFDGVYLFIRYVYTFFKVVLSVFLFFQLRQVLDFFKSYYASLLFLVFSGYGLMVISYNSIAIFGSLLFLLLLLKTDNSIFGWLKRLFSGIFLALSVLGIPHILTLYFLFIIITLLFTHSKFKNSYLKNIYNIRNVIGVSLGAFFIFVLFLFYALHNSSLNNIFNTLPFILNKDPAHPDKSLYQLTFGYLIRIIFGNNRNYILLSFYFLLAICMLLFYLDKYKKNRCDMYVFLVGLSGICLQLIYIVTDIYINSIVFVPNIVCLLLVLVLRDCVNKLIFMCIWIPGMLITYLEYLASNTGFMGIACFSCIPCIASMVIIISVIKKTTRNYFRIPLVIFCALTIGTCLYLRCTYVFWEDGGISSLKETISHGSGKGLVVTSSAREHYDSIHQDVFDINRMPPETNVLYIGDLVLWMSGNQRCASYSPLCYSITTDRELLYDYYQIHPDKKADCVYIEFVYGADIAKEIAFKYGFNIEKRRSGWILMK